MQRLRNRHDKVDEHFGFVDEHANPVLKKSEAGTRFSNQVHLGEVLCGYPNLADKTAAYSDGPDYIRSLLRDGSFLALRKLRQDVEALEDALTDAAGFRSAAGQTLTREELLANMMGRWPGDHPKAGQPLAEVSDPDPLSNDFHFENDLQGKLCPFHAHITARQSSDHGRLSQAAGPPGSFAAECPMVRFRSATQKTLNAPGQA